MPDLLDLEPRLESADVRALLSLLVGWRNDDVLDRAALERAVSSYRSRADLRLYGTLIRERPVGLIGLETVSPAEIVIRHMVVHPAYRALGVGREMLEAVNKTWRPSQLAAETDANAVGFYRRCGFSVTSLGEKYPGTERFWCVLEP